MKILKTASGKDKIKISKKEWQSIGKKAGWGMGETKGDIMGKLELELKKNPNYETFDYALPLTWVNEAKEIIGEDVVPHFVWIYEKGSLAGRPFPITEKGKELLAIYNDKKGSHQ